MKSNVTVIIPCFNDGEFIMEALNSVLRQTLKPEKIIIIDDGSGLETKKILKKIDVDTVEVIFQENKGVCKTRNIGIGLAKTDYILNLDADDYFDKTFVEKAVHLLKNDENIIAVGSLVNIIKVNKIETETKKPIGGSLKNFLVKNNGVSGSIFRKKSWEMVNGFDENMINGYEDWDFWISILKKGGTMHIIQEPLFTYRKKNESRDKSAVEKYDFELRKYIFLKHKDIYKFHFDFYALELLRQNTLFKNNVAKAKTSLEFRIGQNFLAPFRFIKKRFFKW
ncbi:glycosyltransferase family 2 protein [Flaviramulus sp. BrNp1-15]|uniref:glycosyltransferase family 2 protein n=1 Tax=Flaviramulus sp. BrNp1-15 TaxID=2916754 RepID=UPI001EE95322|nr:glycosyltransferase family A protein [Flaviramulus sp. BrNp1-15]ULC60564.1 glycosyltransferase family 2 protein [Flaviramulus sp. BrNp1-15]